MNISKNVKNQNDSLDMNKNILVFDTSTKNLCLGLWCHGEFYECHDYDMQRPHGDIILQCIDDLLAKNGLAVVDLDCLGVGIGPGSFIGVRTAVTVAQGLAYGVSIPIIPVPTLQIVAQHAWNKYQITKALVVIDARMNEIYAARYTKNHENIMMALEKEQLYTANGLQIDSDEYVVVGNAVVQYDLSTLFPDCCCRADVFVDARALLDMVLYKISLGEITDCHQIQPLYVRNDVAKVSQKNKN